MDEAVASYWRKFEDETGEKPGIRCVGQMLGGGSRDGLWGILVVTDRSLRFRHLPSDNWLARMFRPREAQGSGDESVEIIIPLEAVTDVLTPEKGWWRRIFGKQGAQFEVSWTGIDGQRSETFGADSLQFVGVLRQALLAKSN